MSYQSKYTGKEIDELLDKVNAGSGCTTTTLFEGVAGVGDITLSDSVRNYDFILVETSCTIDKETGCCRKSDIYDSKDLKIKLASALNQDVYNISTSYGTTAYYRVLWSLTTENIIKIVAADGNHWTNPRVNKVVGIKLSSIVAPEKSHGSWRLSATSNPSSTTALVATPNTTNTMESDASGNPIFKAGKKYKATVYAQGVNFSDANGKFGLSIFVGDSQHTLCYMVPVNLNYGVISTMHYLAIINDLSEDKVGNFKGLADTTASKSVTNYIVDVWFEEL